MSICNDVEIEAVETWPSDFYQGVAQERDLILSFQRERRRIERLGEKDIMLRINPPMNQYKNRYNALLDRLDPYLTRHRLVGYHCTRLTPSEIGGIRSTGLRVLSAELIRQRLDQCVADGYMTQSHREDLEGCRHVCARLANEQGNRTGMIFLVANRSTLQCASAVYGLFRSWGGEVLNGPHGNELTGIGTPVIVKCAIPFTCCYPCIPTFASRFFSQFVAKKIKYPDPPADFDLMTRVDIPSSQILDVIEFPDPRFEALTACSTWHERYGVNAST